MIAILKQTLALAMVMSVAATVPRSASAQQRGDQDKFGPSDPLAAIDGDPIYLGELNLILTERLKVRELDRVGIEVQQATAALLLRRHLAMRSLRQQGGAAIDAMIARQTEAIAAEAKRRGSSLRQQAESRSSDETSLKADIAWRTAWSQYLKSSLNEKNLKRFFELRRDKYAGGRWRVSQIFVDVDSKDQASVAATRQRMTQLRERLVADASPESAFAAAANEQADGDSPATGGSVGWVSQDGDLPAAVMKAVRQTPAGEISQPVLSPLGMHLVLVHEHEAGKGTFADLADQSQLRRDAADALFDALVRRQADAKVVWFIGTLRPPPGIELIPKP